MGRSPGRKLAMGNFSRFPRGLPFCVPSLTVSMRMFLAAHSEVAQIMAFINSLNRKSFCKDAPELVHSVV